MGRVVAGTLIGSFGGSTMMGIIADAWGIGDPNPLLDDCPRAILGYLLAKLPVRGGFALS